MCLTSGQLFKSRAKKIRSSDKTLQSIQKEKAKETEQGDERRKSSFKIRVNSFHGGVKLDSSMYNP